MIKNYKLIKRLFLLPLVLCLLTLGKVYAQFPAPYCSVTFPSGVYPITKVEFAGISNTSIATPLTGPASENFTSVSGTVNAGSAYQLIVKGNTDGNWSYYVAAYFDWNLDNDFLDANESHNIGIITNSTGVDLLQATANITVPSTAIGGQTRMRITYKYAAYTTSGCNTTGYGQAEDYTINIIRPSFNNASVSALVSPGPVCGGNHDISAMVKNNGGNVINNVTVNWELDGVPQTPVYWSHPIDTFGSIAGNDTVITLGTAVPFLPNTNRAVKVWTSMPNNVADTVNVDDTLNTFILNNCPTYCGISFPLGAYPITSVNFAGINNTSSAIVAGTPEYEFFHAVTPGNVTVGRSYPLRVKGNTDGAWSYYVAVYIDWNQDQDFADFGESQNVGIIYNSTGTDAIEAFANIAVPHNALTGLTRMRVTYLWNAYTTSACNSAGYGQAEDYPLMVNPNVPNNAGVTALVSPVNFCPGQQDIKVRIANKGSNVISNLSINWELDGVPQGPVFWNIPIDTFGSVNSSDTIITLGNALFSGVTRALKVWTSYPNGVPDNTNEDDTIQVAVKPSLGGSYTVGVAPSDYTTLAAAISDLHSFGVCSPVTLNVKSGIYNQQVAIQDIAGASATNTITIQSLDAHADSVVLRHNATGVADNYVLKLSGADYVTVRNVTLSPLSIIYGTALELSGNASYDSIVSCKLTSPVTSGSSTSMSVIYGYGFTGAHNVIADNRILNGAYGIYLQGISTTVQYDSNMFDRNVITGSSYAGAYLQYSNNLKVRGNTITPAAAATYGIYCFYASNMLELSANVISGMSANYGIQTRYITGTAAMHALVSNNSVAIGTGTSTSYGIWSRDGAYMHIYNNSVNVSSSSASTTAGYFYFSSAIYSNNEVKNNIFASNGIGYALFNYSTLYNSLDHNNLYTTGSTLVQSSITPSGNYPNLSAWKAASLQDLRSVSYRPGFTSSTNLMPNPNDSASWSLNGRAAHLPEVSAAINATRPLTMADGVPDLGAYEFTPSVMPPMATANPLVPTAGTTQVFMFAGDTAAKFIWDAFAAVPPAFAVRQYSGEKPPHIGTATHYANFYIATNMAGGSYNYMVEIPYQEGWRGTVSNEHDMRITAFHPFTNWILNAGSTVDSLRNGLSGSFNQEWSYFAGTDQYNPLPVKLLSFDGVKINHDVKLNWVTVAEHNNKGFGVERSFDGKTFEQIDFVKAQQATGTQTYLYTDPGVFEAGHLAVYYRLKQTDMDGKYAYTQSVVIGNSDHKHAALSVYPNPFVNEFSVVFVSPADMMADVLVTDINGRIIYQHTQEMVNGMNKVSMDDLADLTNGVYLIRITSAGQVLNARIIKAE